MNKTVNINLANTFFHIDELAYHKLRNYLDALKKSFAGTKGSDEILSDIEARIAELFREKMESDLQVVTQKEVDEVISIMGQPEDYLVDEDIFDDEPRPKSARRTERSKKLYRDLDHKYIGGVCSGLEHFIGLDALWIRLIFILIVVVGFGSGVVIYILLWILVPKAVTTSQKLDMTGKPINISNIERKVKESFDDVADKVKNVDYQKVGNKVKSGSKSFFDGIASVFMFLFKAVAKFIGILLIIIGACSLIGLLIGLFTMTIMDSVHFPGIDVYNLVNITGVPVWVVSLLGFFAIGIPFFFVLYLGLKILVTNLKSIGNIAKFTLLGVWIIAIALLIALGVKQGMEYAYSATVTEETSLYIEQPKDTVHINFMSSNLDNVNTVNNIKLKYDADGNEHILFDDVNYRIRKSKDSLFHIEVKKDASGSSFNRAKATASEINYAYKTSGNDIFLDDFATSDKRNKFKNQTIRTILFIPEGAILKLGETNRMWWRFYAENDRDMRGEEMPNHTWVMTKQGILSCLDCPEEEPVEEDVEDMENNIKVNKDGIDININDNGESFKMKIDENGVDIQAHDNAN